MLDISEAHTADDYSVARGLIGEYARSLDVDLSFQGFGDELRVLETMYGPPHGTLLIARRGEAVAGCVGLRRIVPSTCEMKRLYVVPSERGAGAGRALAQSAISAAVALGYRTMRLDTLRSMTAAQRLYRELGFREVAPYYENPHAAVYFERALTE